MYVTKYHAVHITAIINMLYQFPVPQIEYLLRGASKKSSHVYFLLQVFCVKLLFDTNVVLMLQW